MIERKEERKRGNCPRKNERKGAEFMIDVKWHLECLATKNVFGVQISSNLDHASYMTAARGFPCFISLMVDSNLCLSSKAAELDQFHSLEKTFEPLFQREQRDDNYLH